MQLTCVELFCHFVLAVGVFLYIHICCVWLVDRWLLPSVGTDWSGFCSSKYVEPYGVGDSPGRVAVGEPQFDASRTTLPRREHELMLLLVLVSEAATIIMVHM